MDKMMTAKDVAGIIGCCENKARERGIDLQQLINSLPIPRK